MSTVHIADDVGALCQRLGDHFLGALRGARDAGRDLRVALSGGSTPRPFFEHLATRDIDDPCWHHLRVFVVDERDVDPRAPDSNLGMIQRLWLDRVGLDPARIHAPSLPAADLERAAREYEATLREHAGEPARLDFVLLGMGEDGHTASLFPGHSSLAVADRDVLGLTDSPKPPPRRLTLSLAALKRAREVHVLVTGASKNEAMKTALARTLEPERYPLHALREAGGQLTWWLDRAAGDFVD